MACKLLLLALLLSCASHTAHSAGVRDHLTSDAAPQGTYTNERINELIIEKMIFTFRDPKTIIDVCLKETSTGDANYASLTFDTNGVSTAHEGTINNSTCAQFEIEGNIPADDKKNTYLLSVNFKTDDGRNTKTATVSFAYTAKSTLVECGFTTLTRTSWSDETSSSDDCIVEASDLPNVCYSEEDKSETDICFEIINLLDTNSNIKVCRNEVLTPISLNKEELTVNYLRYDQTTSPTSAELSYSLGTSPIAIEATIWKNEATPTVILCNESPCSLKDFVPSNAVYDICAVSIDLDNSGHTTIQDVNLYAYDLNEPAIIEFGFLNSGGTSYQYTASLHTYTGGAFVPTDDSVNLDCTDVTAGHYCYGFLYYTTTQKFVGDEAYLFLQYTESPGFENPYNTIASKVLPASGLASGGRV